MGGRERASLNSFKDSTSLHLRKTIFLESVTWSKPFLIITPLAHFLPARPVTTFLLSQRRGVRCKEPEPGLCSSAPGTCSLPQPHPCSRALRVHLKESPRGGRNGLKCPQPTSPGIHSSRLGLPPIHTPFCTGHVCPRYASPRGGSPTPGARLAPVPRKARALGSHRSPPAARSRPC